MTSLTAPTKPLSLADYLQWQAPDEKIYELDNGIIREMPPESELNRRIAMFLLAYFLRQNVPPHYLSQKTEIAVLGTKASTRLPDLAVLSPAAESALRGATHSTILYDMPPSALAIEVVSPGEENRIRDYRYKRAQYEARGIQEYWIVDSQQATVTVRSPFLSTLASEATLTVAAILQPATD